MTADPTPAAWDGRPNNPERDGWHWLLDDIRQPFPAKWDSRAQWWWMQKPFKPEIFVSEGFTYGWPNITPAILALRRPTPPAGSGTSAGEREALRIAAEKATPGRWMWWTSCSWRRLRSDQHDGRTRDVLMPCIQRSDNHPDIIVSDEDRVFMEAAQPSVILRLLSDLAAAEAKAAQAERAGMERAAKIAEIACEEIMRRTETPIARAKEDMHLSEQCHQEGRWHGANDCREDIAAAIRASLGSARQ